MQTHKQPEAAKTNIYVDGVVVGFVEGDTFYKTVKRSAHFLQRPAAIAFALSSLEDATNAGARFVQLYEHERGVTYRASIAYVLEHGFATQRAGYEPQYALPMDKWQDSAALANQLDLFKEQTK